MRDRGQKRQRFSFLKIKRRRSAIRGTQRKLQSHSNLELQCTVVLVSGFTATCGAQSLIKPANYVQVRPKRFEILTDTERQTMTAIQSTTFVHTPLPNYGKKTATFFFLLFLHFPGFCTIMSISHHFHYCDVHQK